jgi:hypothetical protein
MSAATIHRDLGKSLTGPGKATTIATGGTIDLGGRDFVRIRGLGAGTFKLPNVADELVGTMVVIIADGAQTWQTADGSAVGSLSDGEVSIAVARTTSDWVLNTAS